MAINIRSLLLLPVWCLLLWFVPTAQAGIVANVSDACPYGHRNDTIKGSRSSAEACDYALQSYVNTTDPHWCERAASNSYLIKTVKKSDCATTPSDDSGENGCYSENIDPVTGYCIAPNGHQECQGSGGTFTLENGKSCENYCEGPGTDPMTGDIGKGVIHACNENSYGEPLTSGGSGGGTDPESCPSGTIRVGDNCVPLETDPDDPGSGGDTGGGDTGGGDTGGGDTGGGDTGGGDTGGGGDIGGGDTGDQRFQDEQQCGIGLRFENGSCRPIPDNCGYVNGVYACANPEPPSGCGSINNVPGCYESAPGCGYFNGEYGCFDSDDSVNCNGGFLINGVCNKDGQQPYSCPIGYTWDGTICRNSATDCPIGTSRGFDGTCQPDDCPAGKYMLGGICMDIPPPPNAPPGTPNNGPGTGTNPGSPDDVKVDLTSVNSRLDNILNANKTGLTNAVNAQNKTTTAIQNLHETNKQLLSEVKELGGSIDSVKDSVDSLIDSVPDGKEAKPLDDANAGMASHLSEYDAAYDDLISSEFSVQGDSLKSDFLDVVPQYSSCQTVSISMPGTSITISCEKIEQFKRLFGWVLYIWTIIYLFNLALKPVGDK